MGKKYPRAHKKYTDAEREFIANNYGDMKVSTIAEKLERSPGAITRYAENHGLGGVMRTGLFLSAPEVAAMFKVDYTTVTRYWIGRYGLKCTKKALKQRRTYKITLDDLVKWCKNNQDKYSTLHLEEFALGQEFDWLKIKRKCDAHSIPKRQEWTTSAELQLIKLVEQGIPNKDIAKIMNRTGISISRKKCRLIKDGRINLDTTLVA